MMDQSDVARGSRSFGLAAATDREIACPAKAGQRIAAGRCVDAQGEGCFCPQAYSALRGYEAIVAEDGAGLAGAGGSRGNPAHVERAKQRVRLSALKARADGFARQDGARQFAGPGLAAENARRALVKRGGPAGAPAAAPPPVVPTPVPTAPAVRTCPVNGCGKPLAKQNKSGRCRVHHYVPTGTGPAKRQACSKPGCKLFAVADGLCGPCAAARDKYHRKVLAEVRRDEAAKAAPSYAQRRKTDDPAAPLPDVGAPTSVTESPPPRVPLHRAEPALYPGLPAFEALPLGYVTGLLDYLAKSRAQIDGRAA